MPLGMPCLPLSENPNHHPKKKKQKQKNKQKQKRTVQPLGDAFEDTAFKPGLDIDKF